MYLEVILTLPTVPEGSGTVLDKGMIFDELAETLRDCRVADALAKNLSEDCQHLWNIFSRVLPLTLKEGYFFFKLELL
jgi:hypothetical protein